MVSSGFWHTQLSFCVFLLAQLSGTFLKIAFLKKGFKNWVFDFLCFNLKFEASLFLGLLKHYKIGVSANFGAYCC